MKPFKDYCTSHSHGLDEASLSIITRNLSLPLEKVPWPTAIEYQEDRCTSDVILKDGSLRSCDLSCQCSLRLAKIRDKIC